MMYVMYYWMGGRACSETKIVFIPGVWKRDRYRNVYFSVVSTSVCLSIQFI